MSGVRWCALGLLVASVGAAEAGEVCTQASRLAERAFPALRKGEVRVEGCFEQGSRAVMLLGGEAAPRVVAGLEAGAGKKLTRAAEAAGVQIELFARHGEGWVQLVLGALGELSWVRPGERRAQLRVSSERLAEAVGWMSRLEVLSGWRLQVVDELALAAEIEAGRALLLGLPALSEAEVESLLVAGYRSAADLATADVSELQRALGTGPERAVELRDAVAVALEAGEARR